MRTRKLTEKERKQKIIEHIQVSIPWTDEDTGYQCLAIQMRRMGHWCGYVRVDPDHPAYKDDYDSIDIEVHGGLTFAGMPLTAPEDTFWVGFDCAHAFDYHPGIDFDNKGPEEWQRVWTLDDVKEECHTLAAQLKDMEEDNGN